MASVFVLYPPGGYFNLDYYVSTHMPLVESAWKSYGLKSWEVLTFAADEPYEAGARLEWESHDSFKAAMSGPEAKDLFRNIDHYTAAKPIILNATRKASS